MRLSLLAALLVAVWALPAEAARPVKGAVQGTATAATGVARGAGQAGVGISARHEYGSEGNRERTPLRGDVRQSLLSA